MDRQAHPGTGRLKRFGGDRSGATAVEFAFIAPILIMMIFSVLELGMIFMLSSTLDTATTDTARTIRTGTASATAAGFRDQICDRLGWMQTPCKTQLSVDVRTYSQFGGQSVPEPITAGTFDKTSLAYNVGKQGDIVLVRAFYEWKLLTPFLAFSGMRKLSDGTRVMMSSATFKNEPYN